jgi:hypothetical protein
MAATTSMATEGRELTSLRAPRRNRFYYGKLLDALHLTMEQQYGLAADRLMNRFALGAGVVCGLEVTPVTSGTPGLRIGAGLAIDGWGRRIVVPDDHDLVPLELTNECGDPEPPANGLPVNLVVSVCYRECETDFAPALVPEHSCNGNDRCEAGTIFETYAVRVREGTADDAAEACTAAVKKHLSAGDLHGALCVLGAAACNEPPADSCVVLANVTLLEDGTYRIEQCVPRSVVPTNQVLLQLIACLAERIEECCNGTTPTDGPTDTPTDNPTDAPTEGPTEAPTEGPTDAPTETPTEGPTDAPTETPTEGPTDAPTDAPTDIPTEGPTEEPTAPPTDVELRINALEYWHDAGLVVSMETPKEYVQLKAADVPRGIDITFIKGVPAQASVKYGKTFLVKHSAVGLIPGKVTWIAGNVVRFTASDDLPVGEYIGLVRGDPPAVMTTSASGQPAVALDGEPTDAWPTGDDKVGGNFEFRFNILP